MLENILLGPPDSQILPKTSLGKIFFDVLQKWDSNRTILVDYCTNEEITYGKLLKSSVAIAIKLQSLGIKKDDVVSIVSRNCWKYLSTIIAGLYVGAKVSLLNPDYTYGELKHFFTICQPSVVFSTSDLLDKIQTIQNEETFLKDIVIFDNETVPGTEHFDKIIENENTISNFNPIDVNPSEDVAFIFCSSGTTGLPKCVKLTHINFRVTMLFTNDPLLLDINQNESLLGYLPFFHILGNAVCLAGILFGAKVIIIEKFASKTFLKSIEEHKITKLIAVPPILLFLVKNPLVQEYDISSIRDVLCGAASVSKDLEEIVRDRLKITSVRQVYGMTEISGAATLIPKNVHKYGSSGKAATTCQIKVCEPQTGRIQPVNGIGEIRVKSDGNMKGYLGNDHETREAFDEEGFLKTGDLGYYDSEGFFYIVGRLKEIIKYKGFQVSPAELENVLVQHSAVKDAAVIGVPDERAGEVPLAFVVLQPNKTASESELVDFVAEHVSVQKRLYGGVRFVDQIPKNSSGKILRRKLQELL